MAADNFTFFLHVILPILGHKTDDFTLLTVVIVNSHCVDCNEFIVNSLVLCLVSMKPLSSIRQKLIIILF